MQLVTGAWIMARECRDAAAAHRWISVPSGQTEVTVQSFFSPFLAAPSATSATRHQLRIRTPSLLCPCVREVANCGARGGGIRTVAARAIKVH